MLDMSISADFPPFSMKTLMSKESADESHKCSLILLRDFRFCVVDERDFAALSQHKWLYHDGGYAFRKGKISEGQLYKTRIYMHRQVMGFPEGLEIDHIGGDGLDNRRSELRPCTKLQNQQHRIRKRKNTSSKYRGISWHTKSQKWCAAIVKDKKSRFLGSFTNEVEAALAYNRAATELFGEFASLNKVAQC